MRYAEGTSQTQADAALQRTGTAAELVAAVVKDPALSDRIVLTSYTVPLGDKKDAVLAHKRAIDEHLESVGIPVQYTNVFWGGRSEIKPSEISPFAYLDWCAERGVNPEAMREG